MDPQTTNEVINASGDNIYNILYLVMAVAAVFFGSKIIRGGKKKREDELKKGYADVRKDQKEVVHNVKALEKEEDKKIKEIEQIDKTIDKEKKEITEIVEDTSKKVEEISQETDIKEITADLLNAWSNLKNE